MRTTPSALTMARIWSFSRRDDGQDLIEYGLLASLIATFLIGMLTVAGEQINGFWTLIAAGIPQ